MDWETARKIPWNIVLLFGGGFALALGFQSSGLALWFGEQLLWTKGVHPMLILLCGGNPHVLPDRTHIQRGFHPDATAGFCQPGPQQSGNNPLLIMIPATLASSLAFMLPTATPPNAIIFGTNRIQISTMVRTGFVLNMIGVLVVVLITWLLGKSVLGIDLGVIPDWALSINNYRLMKTPSMVLTMLTCNVRFSFVTRTHRKITPENSLRESSGNQCPDCGWFQ